ncbi:MAG: phospholipid-binding protein [Geobacteraceae bacterium GWC2_58_44]|nr:MAG: phospholipid-binding protein [Geobacteraceae bacterium GWC2_58_44]HBG06604.1 phospholipid-binding protein [Geobacter sp.]
MKKLTFLIASALSAAVAFSAPYPVSAEQHEPTKADNTKMNKQESKEETAEQQKGKKSDREMTRNIRRAVVKNKSLSTYAHNVKIIARDGMVTLKGPVRSEKEKQIVEQAAARVAGKGKVTNELEVTPKKAD